MNWERWLYKHFSIEWVWRGTSLDVFHTCGRVYTLRLWDVCPWCWGYSGTQHVGELAVDFEPCDLCHETKRVLKPVNWYYRAKQWLDERINQPVWEWQYGPTWDFCARLERWCHARDVAGTAKA